MLIFAFCTTIRPTVGVCGTLYYFPPETFTKLADNIREHEPKQLDRHAIRLIKWQLYAMNNSKLYKCINNYFKAIENFYRCLPKSHSPEMWQESSQQEGMCNAAQNINCQWEILETAGKCS